MGKRWNIWTLSEEDIDMVAENMGMTNLTKDQKEDIAKSFKKGVETLLGEGLGWEDMLQDSIRMVSEPHFWGSYTPK